MQARCRALSTSTGGHGRRCTGLSQRRGCGLKRLRTRKIARPDVVEDEQGTRPQKDTVLCDLRLDDEEGRGRVGKKNDGWARWERAQDLHRELRLAREKGAVQ